MKILKLMTLCLTMISGTIATAQDNKTDDLVLDSKNAKATLLEKDAGLQDFFDNSAGYVIFPNVGKGGFIVGGASGNGILYENGIAQGVADLKKVSVGFQAGGQAVIEIIFFKNENDLNEFKDGDFEFAAGVSAVALKSGIAANAKFKDGIAVFTLPKAGLMADASVGGQKFSYESFAEEGSK